MLNHAILAIALSFSANLFADVTGTQVRNQVGKYAFEILENRRLSDLIAETLTGVYAEPTAQMTALAMLDLNASLAVSVPSTLVANRFLVVTGCQAHNCGEGNRAMFIIDSRNPSAVLIVRKNQTVREAIAILASGEWARILGVDIGRLPALVRAAIADL